MPSRRRAAEKGLQISNPDKVLYPAGKFTKADVLSYYERVARFLLPHFRNRPVTLKRYPNGVFGEAFYEKDAPGFTPRSEERRVGKEGRSRWARVHGKQNRESKMS